MFLSALLAGSVLPFNSEVVIAALRAAGLEPWGLLVFGTVGNVAGGLFNYWIGVCTGDSGARRYGIAVCGDSGGNFAGGIARIDA